MKKLFLILGMCLVLGSNIRAEENKDEIFERVLSITGNFEENLHRFKQKPLVDLTEEEEKSITGFSIERKINPQYIEEYERKFKKKYAPTDKLNPWLAVYYDPEYFMEYLERIPARTLAQKYQLLVLWQIYKSEKVNTVEYKEIAAAAYAKTLEYLSDDDNWQASWRRDEYKEIVQDDFQKCYADTDCLLKAIPYWMDLRIPMKVILPCDFAKEHNLLYYADYAAGGSGTQTIMISSCVIDKENDFEPKLDAYIDNVIFETTPYSSGSIIHVFLASADAHYWNIKYQPDFKADKMDDWREFPYTEWAVQSYYNFKKFNEVINKGIGYKKAVEMLKEHYINVFNATPAQALNTALIVLNPPSSLYFKRITPENLNYLLLTGAPWNKIDKQLTEDINPAKLLELSIAHPQNLRQLVKRVKNVDEPNNFGKTPLQAAAQYGYLESVKILLEAGADINHQTDDANCFSDYEVECIHTGKRTALMYALQENQFEVSQYLLDKGADITLTDSQEKTALDYLMKLAPKFSTHAVGTIYGGEANTRVPEDDEKLPPQQYEQLYKRLFFNQQQQIAEILQGVWFPTERNKKDNLLKYSVLFEKNTNKDEPLVRIKDYEGVFAECVTKEDSQNVFNCTLKSGKNEFYVYFAISHYYGDKLTIYYGFKSDNFSECLKRADCSPEVLATFEREVKRSE